MNVKNLSVLALTPDSPGQLYAIRFPEQSDNELERWRSFFSDESQIRMELEKRNIELIRDSHDRDLILQKVLSEGAKFVGLFEKAAKMGNFKAALHWKDFDQGSGKNYALSQEDFKKTIYPGEKVSEQFENRRGDLIEYDTSHSRLYALKYRDDTLVIIGGCLKTTDNLNQSDFTRHIPNLVQGIAELFDSNGVNWNWFKGKNFTLKSEENEDDA